MTLLKSVKLALVLLFILSSGCTFEPPKTTGGRLSIFVGIDISGSFRTKPEFRDALEFLSYYIYAHLHQLGELKKPKALFVASIGGDYPDDPQIFHSLYDFEGKSVKEIHKDLRKWFDERNRLTDFNTFFKALAKQVKKRNLTLTPLSILIISDGIPEGTNVKKGRAGRLSYSKIDLDPLEYLARNVTVRLLYASAKAGKNWEDYVPRKRVRLWTAADQVMKGWRSQLNPGKPPEEQAKLFEWIKYNVDYRVRVKKF